MALLTTSFTQPKRGPLGAIAFARLCAERGIVRAFAV